MLGCSVETLDIISPDVGQDAAMHANGCSFPALIIYTVDSHSSKGGNGKQPLIYQREDHPADPSDDWTDMLDVHLGLDAGTTYDG
jgi:hypothetical protein